jgi:hypothetical protein
MGRKRLAGLALVAGLAGGGIAGALFGAPGISGAQETTTSTTAPPATAPDGGAPGAPGGHGEGCIGGHRGAGIDAAAKALGMTAEELRSQLDADTTIADVAKAKGVDVQKVIDAMVADAKTHLDQAVTDGRLTQAEADAKKADLTDRITSLVNEGPPARPAPPA